MTTTELIQQTKAHILSNGWKKGESSFHVKEVCLCNAMRRVLGFTASGPRDEHSNPDTDTHEQVLDLMLKLRPPTAETAAKADRFLGDNSWYYAAFSARSHAMYRKELQLAMFNDMLAEDVNDVLALLDEAEKHSGETHV